MRFPNCFGSILLPLMFGTRQVMFFFARPVLGFATTVALLPGSASGQTRFCWQVFGWAEFLVRIAHCNLYLYYTHIHMYIYIYIFHMCACFYITAHVISALTALGPVLFFTGVEN